MFHITLIKSSWYFLTSVGQYHYLAETQMVSHLIFSILPLIGRTVSSQIMVGLVLLELRAAFDVIDHGILRNCLHILLDLLEAVAATLWNNFPFIIRMFKTLNVFEKKVKTRRFVSFFLT